MQQGLTGHHVPISTAGESARAFVPHSLPPKSALHVEGELGVLLDAASVVLLHEALQKHHVLSARTAANRINARTGFSRRKATKQKPA